MTQTELSFAGSVLDGQCAEILSALQAGDQLTPLDALRRFNCFRLGARIWDLRAAGYDVQTEMVRENGKRYARYWLASGTVSPAHAKPRAEETASAAA